MPRDKEKQRAYYKAYYAANREKILAQDKAYRLAHGEEIEARRREKLRTDPEARRKEAARQARYVKKHPGRWRAICRRAAKRYRDSLKALDAAQVKKAQEVKQAQEKAQAASQGFVGTINPGRI